MKINTREEFDLIEAHTYFCDIPEELYHSIPPLGQSNLCKYEISPAHFIAAKQGKFKTSPQMILGSAIHTAILEPHLFDYLYTRIPDELKGMSKNKKEYKDWKSMQKGTILDDSQFEQITHIATSALHHPRLGRFLIGGQSELVGIARDQETGLQRKCRIDKYHGSATMIVDLKTSSKRVASKQYLNSIIDFNYIVQAAYYLDIAKAITGLDHIFLLIAVEVDPPYGMIMYEFDEQTIKLGRSKYRRYLDIHKQCSIKKEYPGYDDPIRSFRAPDWAFRNEGLDELISETSIMTN